jgi:lipopolysaccharide/colanic/teichoic acid biosynthesis glycosyltransferase
VLVVVLAPLLLVIAAAVKLTSRGPVLFRQTRVGRHGGEFAMLKFRTMVLDAEERKNELRRRNEAAPMFKIADDPRATAVGRLLRRRSLDELPQLFNVLRGDMSLVGPRPLIMEEARLFSGWQRRRYHVAPGMTGPWQILGSSRVVAMAGCQDHGPHDPVRAQPAQSRARSAPELSRRRGWITSGRPR